MSLIPDGGAAAFAAAEGARRTGKSSLAEHLVPGERRYASLDDLDVLDPARRDPGLGGELLN